MKPALIAQVLIAALVLTACGSTSMGSAETTASAMSGQSGDDNGRIKGSVESAAPEAPADSPVVESAPAPADVPDTADSAAPPVVDSATSDDAAMSATEAAPLVPACPLTPGAKCDGADLTGMNLSGKDLSGISLQGAILVGTNLTSANLTNARLTGATISNAVWTGADLTGATTGFDALDPALQSAKTCRTRMAKGVIDSRGCPCRSAGGATVGSEPWIGSMGLGAISVMPRSFAAAEGQVLPVSQNPALTALVGGTWGGNGKSNFALPQVTGPWAGVRTGANGDGKCLQWAVAVNGMFANTNIDNAFPGEVHLSAVTAHPFRNSMIEAGAEVDNTISAYLGRGFTAYALPSSWPAPPLSNAPTYLAELRLFTTAQPLPAPFIPADGSAITPSRYPKLQPLLGNAVPLVVAPDGYQWAVATEGVYPTN